RGHSAESGSKSGTAGCVPFTCLRRSVSFVSTMKCPNGYMLTSKSSLKKFDLSIGPASRFTRKPMHTESRSWPERLKKCQLTTLKSVKPGIEYAHADCWHSTPLPTSPPSGTCRSAAAAATACGVSSRITHVYICWPIAAKSSSIRPSPSLSRPSRKSSSTRADPVSGSMSPSSFVNRTPFLEIAHAPDRVGVGRERVHRAHREAAEVHVLDRGRARPLARGVAGDVRERIADEAVVRDLHDHVADIQDRTGPEDVGDRERPGPAPPRGVRLDTSLHLLLVLLEP